MLLPDTSSFEIRPAGAEGVGIGRPAAIIAGIGGEQAAQGINLPLDDLIIGATAVELGYAVATSNLRDFNRIPGLRVVQLLRLRH